MSIAFVLFHEHPETMQAITEQVKKAIGEVGTYGTAGCLTVTFCGIAILSRFNSVLRIVDQKLGELGIVRVAEFFAHIVEVIYIYIYIHSLKITNGSKVASIKI